MQRPKQRSRFNPAPPMDFTSKIKDVLDATACGRHNVSTGIPCFHVRSDAGGYFPGICGSRAKKIYNGQIDPKSVRQHKSPKKEHTR